VRWPAVLVAAPLAAATSAIGTFVLLAFVKAAAEWIRPVFAVLFVLLALQQARRALRRSAGPEAAPERGPASPSAFVGATGLYDGAVGPGTGMFLFWAFTTWAGLLRSSRPGRRRRSTGRRRRVLSVLLAREILWEPALAMASMNLVGGFFGAHAALRRGVPFVRLVTAGVSLLAAAYLLYQSARGGG